MSSLGVFRDDFYPGITALPSYNYFGAFAVTAVPPGAVSGFAENYASSSNAGPLQLPTANAIYNNIIAALAATGVLEPANVFGSGVTYFVRLVNTNAGTVTLTGGNGVTINGLATLVTNSYRDYVVTVLNSGTVTFQSVGSGTL
jgi:hypothetical protein